MSWNGSTGTSENHTPKQTKSRKVLFLLGIGIFACFGIVMWRCFTSHKTTNREQETQIQNQNHISEQRPKIKVHTTSNVVAKVTPIKLLTDDIAQESHKAKTTTNKFPRRVIQRRQSRKRRFEHNSDELIAHLLETKPGALVVGRIPFERFENEFRTSIADPIKISEEDSEYDRNLKTSVMQARKEIAKMIGDGRTFADVMYESRAEFQKLAQYKYQLLDELHKAKNNPETTDEDYRDFVEAANKMLESKGVSPIKAPSLLYNQLKFQDSVEGERE